MYPEFILDELGNAVLSFDFEEVSVCRGFINTKEQVTTYDL